MNRRRSTASVAANPVLVGAVTLLVVVVAVFLAYNANNGLPFIPTRQLKVDVASGSNLVGGNEVREGGFRIGVVEDIKPVVLRSGQAGAQLVLKLDKANGRVPVDSTVVIRPRSALGLKYVQLTRGHAKKIFADGGTLPAAQARVPVQFDDIYSTFDAKTRKASQDNLVGFGGTLAARGGDLNLTIAELPPLFARLRPVAANLSDPRTNLPRFLRELNITSRVLAPVAGTQARLFTDLSTTFAAFSRDARALQATISKSPPTIDVSTVALRAQRPFLRDLAAFSGDLNLASGELRAALPDINRALEVGAPVLRRSVALNSRLQNAMRSLSRLALAPGTNTALRGLTDTVDTLNPQLRFLGPYQTVCNGWNYFWTFLQEHLSEEDAFGYAQRAELNSTGQQKNSVGSGSAVVPANGEGYKSISAPQGAREFFHGQAYNAAITKSGAADCETGQFGYLRGRLSTSGQPDRFNIVTNSHTPGAQGPTYTGRARVPKGETFQREPNIGALP